MMLRLLSILLVLTWFADDGEKEGRKGNELYSEKEYGAAVEAYERGLESLSENAPAMLRYGLLNNLGAALLKSGDPEAAGDAFTRAMASAPESTDLARSSYNACNAAFSAADLETALARYRESLLEDPENEDAKFNYEFVKRQLEQQQEQQQNRQDEGDRGDENEQNEQQQEQQEGSENPDRNQDQPQNENGQQDGSEDEQQPSEEEEDRRQGQTEAEQSAADLSSEEAERILEALRNEEEQLLRQVQRPQSRPRQVEKDW